MRITSSVIVKSTLAGLQSQMRALEDVRQQAATGLKVRRASDDPVAAAGIMQSSSGLEALAQYRRNLEAGRARLAIEDSALDQLGDALTRARELGLTQASGTASAATRAAARAEVDGLIDFAKNLANTRSAGSFVFGGTFSDTAPFVGGATDPAKPPAGDLTIEVGSGRFVKTNHSAQEIFLDSGAVDALQSLSDALAANDSDAIAAAVTGLDTAFNQVQEVVGDLGARASQLDVTLSNIEALEVNLQTFRAGLSDADLTKAVIELVDRQGALQAAMAANQRILELTLSDFLR